MLVVNKLAVHYLPAPSFVLLTQFFASWFVVKGLGVCGAIEVDALEWKKLRAFLPISAAFVACVYANIKTLQYANVRLPAAHRARRRCTPCLTRALRLSAGRRWRRSLSSALQLRSPSRSPSGASSGGSFPTCGPGSASFSSSPPP